MDKHEVQQRVLLNGEPLSLDKFHWNKKSKIFTTGESKLVLDFTDISGITFNTEHKCTFITGPECTFNTGKLCTFETAYNCTFHTGSECVFNTGWSCRFITGNECTFNVANTCEFLLGDECVIIRRDIFEIIHPLTGLKIKLNKLKGIHNV